MATFEYDQANWLGELRKPQDEKDALKSEIESLVKGRRYIQDPSQAPDDVEVQEGPQGGLYYETDDGGEEEEGSPAGTEEIPEFYDAEFNDYVQAFMEQQGIESLEVPERPDHDDVRDAKETWEDAKDYASEIIDEVDDPETAFEVVSFASNRLDEMRSRRNNRGGGSGNTPDPPETPEPISEEELEEYDGEIPDDIPDDMEPMFAIADMSDSYRQFRETVNQNGMMDISNRKIHRFGRALSGDPDYELPDLANMEDADLSGIADYDPETARRIQDAQEDGTITMYRAVPKFVDDVGVGDYVALNPEYVQRHGENVLGSQQDEAWHVLEEEVPLEDVAWPGEDAEEFVYSPKEIRERWPSTKHFYEDVSGEDEKMKAIRAVLEETIEKERVYIDDPSEAPEDVSVQEGEQGGLYYETEDIGEGDGEIDGDGGEPPTADELVSEVGLESMEDVQEVIARGIEEGANIDDLADRISEEKSDRYINRVLNDVEQAVSQDVEGYENPAKMVYSWDDDFDFPEEAEQKFIESVDDETAEMARESLETWPLDFFSEDMAPLWKTVMAETGNENLLKDEEEVTDTEVSEEEMDAIRAHKEHVEETLRELHGDTITVYRGVYGDAGSKLQEAAESGEEVEWERRAVESYTTELTYAKSYAQNPGGVVVEDEIPVEDVWASSHTGFLDANENELVVQREEVETVDPENIHTPETLDDGEWNLKEVAEQAREFRT